MEHPLLKQEHPDSLPHQVLAIEIAGRLDQRMVAMPGDRQIDLHAGNAAIRRASSTSPCSE